MKIWTLLIGVLFIVFALSRLLGNLINPDISQTDLYISIAALVVGVVLALVSRGMKETKA
jgi:hypothetical protein